MGTTLNSGLDGTTRHLAHDWRDDTTIEETIVSGIGAFEGEDPDALPPLDRQIDPDALDALFDVNGDRASAAGCVTFSYYGYTVLVRSTGAVLVRRD